MTDYTERYSQLLRTHLQEPGEACLAAAADLGKELVASGVPPEEMAELQQEALQQLLLDQPTLTLGQIALPMSALQSEMLMAYGMVFREQLEDRKRSEQQLRQNLREKELLLAEIHHRVKNNLQIMSSLFSLQMRFSQDPELQKILKESQSRIRSMALIHEKLYHSQDFEQLDFADYLKSLSQYLLHLYASGGVRLKFEIDPVKLNMEQAIPCGMIVTELVSNALKHAFPDSRSGEILIGFHQDSASKRLIVSDNGIGMAKKPDFNKARSLGLYLIKTLAGQLKARIEVEHRQGLSVSIICARD